MGDRFTTAVISPDHVRWPFSIPSDLLRWEESSIWRKNFCEHRSGGHCRLESEQPGGCARSRATATSPARALLYDIASQKTKQVLSGTRKDKFAIHVSSSNGLQTVIPVVLFSQIRNSRPPRWSHFTMNWKTPIPLAKNMYQRPMQAFDAQELERTLPEAIVEYAGMTLLGIVIGLVGYPGTRPGVLCWSSGAYLDHLRMVPSLT